MSEQFKKTEKGLACCERRGYCEGHCPYYEPEKGALECTSELAHDAYTMIRQQAEEIHDLKTKIHELQTVQTARVMTLEEAIEAVSKKGGFVWIEQKSHPLCDAHVSPSNSIFDCPSRKFKDYGKRFIPKKNSFRFMWRCWTSWPTDEQREDAKWDE